MIEMLNKAINKVQIVKYNNDSIDELEDHVSIEEPLEISIQSKKALTKKNISITMRTPGDDSELAAGFLFTEAIIAKPQLIQQLEVNDNKALVHLSNDCAIDLDKITRHFYTSSSCGVCGKASIEAIHTLSQYTPTNHILKVNDQIIKSLPKSLREHQAIFQQTGGLHAAAFCDTEGNIIKVMEDVGRHNALDKLIGHYFLNDRLPLDHSILLLSGRISFELVQKAIMAGIQFIIAVGAPSSLAIQLAEEYDVTLVGFAKADRFNVYNGNHRIKLKA